MLSFLVFDDGEPARQWPLRNAYMVGADGNPMRAELAVEDGAILCDKRETGVAALTLQYRVGDLGELTLQTCLLPDREQPYVLVLELARHRLMMLYVKLEDWGMFDLDPDHPVSRRLELARRTFLEALGVQLQDPVRASALAQQALAAALDGTEELALAHAQLLLRRRQTTGALPAFPIGCGVSPDQSNEALRAGLAANMDFIQLPTPWRMIAPEEAGYRWEQIDEWAQWAVRNRLPLVAGPVVSFEAANLPDWLYIWEHDYETVRDLIYEHVERVVSRYKSMVTVWKVVSGLHINSQFSFTFEQLMDLTRMSCMLVKKLAPAARAVVEIRQPFGEYYASDHRSIPPLMYADLIIQSNIPFDAMAVRLLMGQALSGQYTRDLMQVSNLLDQFAAFGKPLYLTLAAPSEPVTQVMIAPPDGAEEPLDDNSGFWRLPWSPVVQSHWLEAVFQIAMSKPFVEAVAWQDAIDHPRIEMPLGGLVNEEMQAKAGYRRLVAFRRNLISEAGVEVEGSKLKVEG